MLEGMQTGTYSGKNIMEGVQLAVDVFSQDSVYAVELTGSPVVIGLFLTKAEDEGGSSTQERINYAIDEMRNSLEFSEEVDFTYRNDGAPTYEELQGLVNSAIAESSWTATVYYYPSQSEEDQAYGEEIFNYPY